MSKTTSNRNLLLNCLTQLKHWEDELGNCIQRQSQLDSDVHEANKNINYYREVTNNLIKEMGKEL